MLLRRTTEVEIVIRVALYSPLPVGGTRLSRAVAWSLLAHGLVALVIVLVAAAHPLEHASPELVDIEIAPPPPPVEALPAEVAKPEVKGATEAAAAAKPAPADEHEAGEALDAGVDAAPPIDAALRIARSKPEAAGERCRERRARRLRRASRRGL